MTKTTVALSAGTKRRLDRAGRRGETYEEIIIRVLDAFEAVPQPTVRVRS